MGAGRGCASLASCSDCAPLLLGGFSVLCSKALGSSGLAEEARKALSARRAQQMFCCSTVPENNSLVWEGVHRSPGTEAASPSSINSSTSSTNLRLCCWVVSAPTGDRNLETDFYPLDEVSFPPGMDPKEISWADVS